MLFITFRCFYTFYTFYTFYILCFFKQLTMGGDAHGHQCPPPVTDGAANKLIMPTGVELRLGNYTGQSYITYRNPKEGKQFHLLVACSSKQAARNGKHHHHIMSSVWKYIREQGILPTKQDCKVLVLDLLK